MYSARRGQSLKGTYKRGFKNKFVIYHCSDAFKKGSTCVDGVCRPCKLDYNDSGHADILSCMFGYS